MLFCLLCSGALITASPAGRVPPGDQVTGVIGCSRQTGTAREGTLIWAVARWLHSVPLCFATRSWLIRRRMGAEIFVRGRKKWISTGLCGYVGNRSSLTCATPIMFLINCVLSVLLEFSR